VAQLYTPRHQVPISVVSNDTHGLRWDYSCFPAPHRRQQYDANCKIAKTVSQTLTVVVAFPMASSHATFHFQKYNLFRLVYSHLIFLIVLCVNTGTTKHHGDKWTGGAAGQ
jgi:hypothetical protein